MARRQRQPRTDRRQLLRPVPAWRMAILMLVNLTGYCLACAFWRYLATGRWSQFVLSAYREDLTRPLGRMLEYPLDVFAYPWMIAVIGLLLAAMILVPIMVAVLYRLVFAAMFVAVIVLLGHAPALALAVLVGCFVAARTPLRNAAPFAAFLLGLLPVGLYLLLSALAVADVAGLGRLVQHAPFALAVVASMAAAGTVLGLVRLSRYRPGVLWPVMTVLLIGPAAIFYGKVGPDELAYSLIAGRVAGPDSIFEPVALATWARQSDLVGLNDVTLRTRAADELDRRRGELIRQCRTFLDRYGRSRRAPSVLWAQAQCASLRLNGRAFEAETPVISYTASFPLPSSAETWRRLAAEYSGTPQAALARWRLAELALRRQQIGQAEQLLETAEQQLARFYQADPAGVPGARLAGVFRPVASLPSRDYCADASFKIRKLLWLIEQNQLLDDSDSAAAMAALTAIDPNRADYGQRIAALLDDPNHHHENTLMGDNLMLEVAKASPDIYDTRAETLMWLAGGTSDAAIQANYELALLLMRQPVLRLKPGIEDCRTYLKRVKEGPPNPWSELAAEQLDRLRLAAPINGRRRKAES